MVFCSSSSIRCVFAWCWRVRVRAVVLFIGTSLPACSCAICVCVCVCVALACDARHARETFAVTPSEAARARYTHALLLCYTRRPLRSATYTTSRPRIGNGNGRRGGFASRTRVHHRAHDSFFFSRLVVVVVVVGFLGLMLRDARVCRHRNSARGSRSSCLRK